jgi:hypothetical protein
MLENNVFALHYILVQNPTACSCCDYCQRLDDAYPLLFPLALQC